MAPASNCFLLTFALSHLCIHYDQTRNHRYLEILPRRFPQHDAGTHVVGRDSHQTFHHVLYPETFFFPPFLKGKSTEEKEDYVGNELIERAIHP